MSIVAGYNGALLITAPPSVNLSANFELQDTGDHTTFVVANADAAYRYWDRDAVFTFQTSPDGSTDWTDTTPAKVQFVGGKVTFPAAITGTTPSARITEGKYLPYAVLGYVKEWTWDGEWNFEDSTVLTGDATGANGSRASEQTPTTFKSSFKAKKFWVDEETLTLASYVTTPTPLIVSCVVPGGSRYEGYVYEGKRSIALAPDKLVTDDLEFPVDGPLAIS